MSRPKLLYIPGYNGKGSRDSSKIKLLSRYADVDILHIGSYNYIDYIKALDSTKIENYDCLCGTSLGGYWAKLYGDKNEIAQILLNPVLDPFLQLTGIATDSERDLYIFATPITQSVQGIPSLVVVSEFDPVITSAGAINLFQNTSSFNLLSGSNDHSLNDSVNSYSEAVKTFLTDSIYRIAQT